MACSKSCISILHFRPSDRNYQKKGLHLRLSYPDTTVAFQYNTTNTQIVPVASESQNINTLAQQAGGALGGIATCTTNPLDIVMLIF